MSIWLFDCHLETDLKVSGWGFSETHDLSFCSNVEGPGWTTHSPGKWVRNQIVLEGDVSMEKAINLNSQHGCGSCGPTPHPANMSAIWVIVIVMS